MEVFVGNAEEVTSARNNKWIIGHFIENEDLRRQEGVEIKWGRHSSGERRSASLISAASTVVILVSGKMKLTFSDSSGERSVVLAKEGDFVVTKNTAHHWEALEDCLVITVRWPSAKTLSTS